MSGPTPAEDRAITATDTDQRFAFGRNWRRYIDAIDVDRIDEAERSLQSLLGRDRLDGARFLDIGCGSGLFSLAARRLGAAVHSFDYDSQSVESTELVRSRWADADDPAWTIEQASILDREAMAELGQFDVVYSWGVLHHTGAMWTAISNAASLVADGGQLCIAIYNDQGVVSRAWAVEKRLYVAAPRPLRAVLLGLGALVLWVPPFLREALLRRRLWRPDSSYRRRRGMAAWTDLVDWMGGYPFEVATPSALVSHLQPLGFELERSTTTQRLGCNELVFVRR